MRKDYEKDYVHRPLPNGKFRYEYIGSLFTIDLPYKQYRKFWILQVLITVAAMAAIAAAVIIPTTVMYLPYVSIPVGISFFINLTAFVKLIFRPLKTNEMERMLYDQTFRSVKSYFIAAAIFLAIGFLTDLVFTAIYSRFILRTIAQLVMIVVSGLLCWLLYTRERDLPVKIKNTI